MSNQTEQNQEIEHKQPAFGTRLQAAREALGWERKDAALRLRLNEKYIIMMEKDRYPSDLPITFIRGYLRSYAKLLQIAEPEIKKGIEPIKPKVQPLDIESMVKSIPAPGTSNAYLMQLFTFIVVLTVFGLVGSWWYDRNQTVNITHSLASNEVVQPAAAIVAPSSNVATANTVTTASASNKIAPTVAQIQNEDDTEED